MNQTAYRTIKVHFAAAQEPMNRIEVSSGTTSPTGLENCAQPYATRARIPKEPWRRLSEDEIDSLVAQEADLGHTTVQLFRAPKSLVSRFHQAVGDTTNCATADEVQIAFGSEEFRSCLEEFGRWAGRFGEVTEERLTRVNRPGLYTVSRDPVEGTFVGMHVDNSYCHALKDRAESPNRLCLNIGMEPRYLLFIDLPLQILDLMLREAGVRETYSEMWTDEHIASPMGLIFMEVFPDYPVLKLRVEPGEGYMAPAENMVHDASTLTMRSWDVLASVFGRFTRSPAC